MAAKDKHPPKNFSTNKMVKAKTGKSFGASVKTAKGSKRVKAGEKNTTSAKTVGASETIEMKHKKSLKKGIYDPSTGRVLRKSNRNKVI